MNRHCAQRSMGDCVTGNPVRMRRYFAIPDIFIRALVREALGDLIAVDSSIARSALDDFRTAARNFWPLAVLRASTFIMSIRKPVAGAMKLIRSCFRALVGFGRHSDRRAPSRTRSGMCAGISRLPQFR